jgi:hypothetical protein
MARRGGITAQAQQFIRRQHDGAAGRPIPTRIHCALTGIGRLSPVTESGTWIFGRLSLRIRIPLARRRKGTGWGTVRSKPRRGTGSAYPRDATGASVHHPQGIRVPRDHRAPRVRPPRNPCNVWVPGYQRWKTPFGAGRGMPAAARKREGSPLPAELPKPLRRQRLRVSAGDKYRGRGTHFSRAMAGESMRHCPPFLARELFAVAG